MYKQAKNVTYKQIQDYVKEKYDFFAHSIYIAEAKRKCGLDVHEPYNSSEGSILENHCPVPRK